MVWKLRIFRVLILFTILWESSAITNRKTYKQYGATRDFRHVASPYQSSSSMDWEIGLREAVHQALLREQYLDPNLQSRLQNAPIIGKQNAASPFGDIAVLARGQLYALTGGNFAFVQDPYSNDCDECHNARRRRCGPDHCEHLNSQHQDRLVALWTVKRLRHRSHDNYQYEIQYTISPMTPLIKEALIKRDGWFDYALPGHVFVIRNDLPNRNHPTNLHTEVFNRKLPHNHFNPEVLIAVDSDGRKHFLHSYPAFYTSSAPKSTHDHKEQELYRKLIETLASKTSTTQKEEGPYKVSLNHFGDITKSSYYKTPTTGSESMVPLTPVYVPVTPQKPTITKPTNILPTPELKTTKTIKPVTMPEATQPMKVTFHYFMAEEDEENDEGRGLMTKPMEKVPLITKTTTNKIPTQKFTTTTETYGADFLFPEVPRVKSKKKYKPPTSKIKTETEGDFLFTTPPVKHTKKFETLTSETSSNIFTAKQTTIAHTETTTSKTPTMATPWQTTPLMTLPIETTQTTTKNQIDDTTYVRKPTLTTLILTTKPPSTTAFTKPPIFTKYSEVPTRKSTKLATALTSTTSTRPGIITSSRRTNLTSIKSTAMIRKSTSKDTQTTSTSRKPILTTLTTKSASMMTKTTPKGLQATRRFRRPNLASNVTSKLSSSVYKSPSSKSTTASSTPIPTTTLKYELTTEVSLEKVMKPLPTLSTSKFTQPVLETEDVMYFTTAISTTAAITSKLTTQPTTSPTTTVATSITPLSTIGQTEPSLILTKTTADVTNPPLTTTLLTTKKEPANPVVTTIPTEFTQSLSTLTQQLTNTPTIQATETPTREIPITTEMKESTSSNYHVLSETKPTEPMKFTTQFASETKTELGTKFAKELGTTVPYTTPSTVWLTKPTTPMKTSQELTTKISEEMKTTESTTMKSPDEFTEDIKTTTKSEESTKSLNTESTTTKIIPPITNYITSNETQSTTNSAPTKITTQSMNTFLSNSDKINEPINVKPAVKDYSDDDIFGSTKSTSKPFKTSSAKVTESELASQLFDTNRKRAFKNSRIIFSNFFEASTTPVPLETVSKEELPRTSQSIETSISYEVNKRKKSSLTNLGYLPPMEITTKSVEEKTQAVTEEPRKVFDDLATQLVNHARTIDYLNRTENKTSSKPKYKRRKNYVPRNRKLKRKRVVPKEN